MLTDAKGVPVRVSNIAESLGETQNYTRVILNGLNDKLKKVPYVSKYISIIPNNSGAYRLAVDKDIYNS